MRTYVGRYGARAVVMGDAFLLFLGLAGFERYSSTARHGREEFVVPLLLGRSSTANLYNILTTPFFPSRRGRWWWWCELCEWCDAIRYDTIRTLLTIFFFLFSFLDFATT